MDWRQASARGKLAEGQGADGGDQRSDGSIAPNRQEAGREQLRKALLNLCIGSLIEKGELVLVGRTASNYARMPRQEDNSPSEPPRDLTGNRWIDDVSGDAMAEHGSEAPTLKRRPTLARRRSRAACRSQRNTGDGSRSLSATGCQRLPIMKGRSASGRGILPQLAWIGQYA